MDKKRQFSPFRVIIMCFAAVTLCGTFLLMLPFSSRTGSVELVDALFTATSASCVTGLAVGDTYTMWSPFGQGVILALIQIGGIGIITLMMYALSAMHAKIKMKNVFVLQEAIGASSSGGLGKMTRFIVIGVLLQEAVGAILLMPVFVGDYGFVRGTVYSVFHSVSAFCNAGFDILGGASLSSYGANLYFNVVISLLVIFGGIGFFVWLDVLKCRFCFSKFALHTKIVAATSALLVFGGAILFFVLFYNSSAAEKMSLFEKGLASLFQSVSARTAGFYTVDLCKIGGPAQLLMIFLMLVGGAPGSTAGGMKVTTLAVVLLYARSIFKGNDDVECFGRRIDKRVVRTAVAIFVLYLSLALVSGVAISAIEGADIIACLFESFSAVATVGLSLSLTPTLSFASKLIIIILMFIGRVGGMTVMLSLSGKNDGNVYRYPVENVTVG